MKLQDGTLWIDNSNLAAMYVGDVVYNGTASVYYTDLQDKTILLKSFSYDSEKSRTFPEEDIGSYFAFDLGLDYGEDDTKIEQLICVEPYWRLTLQKGEIIKQEQVVEYKAPCTCQCGKTIFHTAKPIPPITEDIYKTDDLPED